MFALPHTSRVLFSWPLFLSVVLSLSSPPTLSDLSSLPPEESLPRAVLALVRAGDSAGAARAASAAARLDPAGWKIVSKYGRSKLGPQQVLGQGTCRMRRINSPSPSLVARSHHLPLFHLRSLTPPPPPLFFSLTLYLSLDQRHTGSRTLALVSFSSPFVQRSLSLSLSLSLISQSHALSPPRSNNHSCFGTRL